MKDNFSTGSDNYARYRPTYPDDFFDYLNRIKTGSQNAWDCGTGNGQVAGKLAAVYDNVFATDISQSQLDNAVIVDNVHYSLQPAEKTDFPDNFFDLIIVSQAVHWFDFVKFYAEVNRTAKNNALLVIVGYARDTIAPELDSIVDKLYYNIVGKYWDKERKYIEEGYRTIPFPFEEMESPDFKISYDWTLEHFIGYLETWSAVKHFIKEKGFNPLDLIREELKDGWGQTEKRVVEFPLLLRIGKIKNVS
ncbi:MAG: class I SAM-dependent methyltransferase [Bacteroidetes bacterium]|nr:class I SAM-dependent methyltransferase [Bacteroidota bacterium]MDA1119964.1 class I SAM-dependent methyltransferase [Bacteroidota bacterium]